MGDGVTDYNDDGNDFTISFSENTEIKDKNIVEKVNDFISETKNTLGDDFKKYSETDITFDNGNILENIFEDLIIDQNEKIIDNNKIDNNQVFERQQNFNISKKVLFSVFQTESQEIEGNQKILFQQKHYDTHDFVNDSKFQPNIPGYYQINAGVNCFSQNGKSILIELLKNGKLFKRGDQLNLTSEVLNYKTLMLSTTVYLNGVDDFIELSVFCYPKFSTYPGEEFTWMNGFLIN